MDSTQASSSGRLRSLIEASNKRRQPGRPHPVLLSNSAVGLSSSKPDNSAFLPSGGRLTSRRASSKPTSSADSPEAPAAKGRLARPTGQPSGSPRPPSASIPNGVGTKARSSSPSNKAAKITLRSLGESIQLEPLRPLLHVSAPQPQSLVVFWRSLATMVKAGLQLERSLGYLATQGEDPAMTVICLQMAESIREGRYFSEALAQFPHVFSKLQIKLVQLAEKTGLMDRILGELSSFEERQRALLMKVKSSLTYPALILVFAALLVLFVPPLMMNGLFAMIANSGVEPPALTRAVMWISQTLQSPLFYLPLLTVVSWVLYNAKRWFRDPATRAKIYTVLDYIPPVRKCLQIVGVARFSRALAVQLEAGVTVLLALKVAAEVAQHPELEQRIPQCQEALKNGHGIAESLNSSRFFPKLFVQMVKVGEESASVPDLLYRTADLYDQAVDDALDTLTCLVEPLVMGVIGLVVGTFVVATMLPLSQILQRL